MKVNSNKQALDLIKERMEDYGLSGKIQKVLCYLILEALQNAYERGADSIRQTPDYHHPEDMGR